MALLLALALGSDPVALPHRDLRRLKRMFDNHGVEQDCEYGTEGIHSEERIDPWSVKHR